MLDFSKLSDMSKLANEAKNMQKQQEGIQREQITLLREISEKLDKVISLLRKSE
ncbi:MAG: hypothetical protein P9L96_02035 [Candidatus Gygaella obscura]|nr:hypothetical protein [Candidatus Gygaella obscura]